MQLTSYVVVWSCLAIVVLALALIRYLFALHEDDNLHLSNVEKGMITKQMVFFQHIDAIDRWGKSLTVAALVGGLILAGVFIYQRLP
jgi:hypothetical protein